MCNRFLTNGGQICTAHTRLVVQDGLKDSLLGKLKEELEKLPYCGTQKEMNILRKSKLSADRARACKCLLLSDDPITEKDRGDRAWEDGMTDVVQPVVCDSQHKKVLGFLDEAKAAGTVGSTLPLARHFLLSRRSVQVICASDLICKRLGNGRADERWT